MVIQYLAGEKTMHGVAASAIVTSLIIAGLTYFYGNQGGKRVARTRALMFILAGVSFFIFAVTS